jgi:hypothetical protein
MNSSCTITLIGSANIEYYTNDHNASYYIMCILSAYTLHAVLRSCITFLANVTRARCHPSYHIAVAAEQRAAGTATASAVPNKQRISTKVKLM